VNLVVSLLHSPEFTCNLTGKTYYYIENVIYEIECTLCGLIYVDETEQTLGTRMNGHRYEHSLNNSNCGDCN